MKLFIVLAVCLYSADAAIKCVQGTDGTAAATACTDATATKCSSPKFTEYTGLSTGVNYACGPCAGETLGSTCQECTGTDSTTGCNKAAETGADFKCYKYTFDTASSAFKKADAMETCKRLKSTAIKCNKPKTGATKTTYTSTTGCGPCSTKESETHCESCTTDSCNRDAAIKCVQGTNGTANATACATTTETKCSSPKFVEYTGVDSSVKYACGACAGETLGSTCQECTGTDSTTGCNKAVETAADFKCYSYTYNSTTKAFTKSTTAGTCKRLKDTIISCNKPKTNATSTTYTSKTGCGNCTKSDTHCSTCTTDSCNSALRLVALFVPLMALLVHLF